MQDIFFFSSSLSIIEPFVSPYLSYHFIHLFTRQITHHCNLPRTISSCLESLASTSPGPQTCHPSSNFPPSAPSSSHIPTPLTLLLIPFSSHPLPPPPPPFASPPPPPQPQILQDNYSSHQLIFWQKTYMTFLNVVVIMTKRLKSTFCNSNILN